MKKPQFDFYELNRHYSIDNYLALPDEEKISFRRDLKVCIKNLKKCYTLKLMSKEDVLTVGLQTGNRTAIALSILIDKLIPYSYDRVFHFRDTILILRRQLLEELYNGKNIFYPIDESTVGIDPNFVPFIIGQRFKTIFKDILTNYGEAENQIE